jgi:hypothetical protein
VFACPELLGHPARVLRVSLVGDVVPLENAARSMVGDLRDGRFGDSSPANIAGAGPTEIVG